MFKNSKKEFGKWCFMSYTLYRKDNKMRCTKRQLLAYLLIHPDFSGLTVLEAAKLMGISKTAIYTLLERFQKNCPKAFRIIWTEPKTYIIGTMNAIEHWQKIVEKF